MKNYFCQASYCSPTGGHQLQWSITVAAKNESEALRKGREWLDRERPGATKIDMHVQLDRYQEDEEPLSVEVSAVRQDIDGCETVNDAPVRANMFSVYIRNPLAFHIIDFERAAGWPEQQKAEAFTYADALAEHLGCKVASQLERPAPPAPDPEVSAQDEAEAAMCIWEELLAAKECDQLIARHFSDQGTGAIRLFALSLAKPCHIAWEKARAAGYDDCFDWEFVPDWLAANVDWTGARPEMRRS